MVNKTRFWNLPKCSKLDILTEGEYNHTSVILAALSDEETFIEQVDRRTYTIYGTDESLLVKPISSIMGTALYIYCTVLTFIHNN
jgi:hypothetical protein